MSELTVESLQPISHRQRMNTKICQRVKSTYVQNKTISRATFGMVSPRIVNPDAGQIFLWLFWTSSNFRYVI